MTECPQCHQQIQITEAHHGTLFSCPKCNGVYFVGWDGLPELPPTAEEMAAEIPGPEVAFAAFASAEASPEADNSQYNSSEYESLATNANELLLAEEPSPFVSNEIDKIESTPVEVASELSETIEGENAVSMSEDFAPLSHSSSSPEAFADATAESTDYNFDEPMGQIAVTADESDFSEVTEFANSTSLDGPLTYTVKIEGIDSGQLYADLKEALNDEKFAWDPIEVVKGLQDGVLTIEGLNPAKAFVLINRIKYLSLKISWRQNVFSAS